MDNIPCVRVSRCHGQYFRKFLESNGVLDPSLRLQRDSDETVLLPVLSSCVSQLDLLSLRDLVSSDSVCEIVWIQSGPQSKKEKSKTRCRKLENVLQQLLEFHGERWTEELGTDLPRSFQRHGDLVLLGDACFSLSLWEKLGEDLWSSVATGLGAKRLAKTSRVSKDGFRSPVVKMLLGEDSWVRHVDNGISYEFDVTKCMFSAGNVSEKLRVAALNCTGETVVDLYAGIGYFTLPYLVHAGAAHVHACEWNPAAIEALQKNLEANQVSDRCTIHPGDNRQLQLSDIADRINLGLIPSSEDGWPVACRLLKKKSGGVLHIHQNISLPSTYARATDDVVKVCSEPSQRFCGKKADRQAWRLWAEDTAKRIAVILKEINGTSWETNIQHIENVKSYAPHIHHVVLDLECRPERRHTAEGSRSSAADCKTLDTNS